MIVETRKTAAGTEYWDNFEKRTLFVPIGKETSFEVTTEYKSLIGDPGKEDPIVQIDFESMTVLQLKEYAAVNDIEIAKDVNRKPDIIKLLSETE